MSGPELPALPRRVNGLFSYPQRAPALPLVPRILVDGPAAGELHNPRDYWGAFTENCLVRGIGGGIAGGLFGFLFGAVFSTGMGSLSAHHDPALRDWQASVAARGAAGGAALPLPPEPPKQPLLQVLREGLLESKNRGVSQGRAFAKISFMITTIECSLETVRGKKDIKNAIVAGFTSGAVIAARSGPTAALLSGGMFAGFSVAMEIAAPYLFGH